LTYSPNVRAALAALAPPPKLQLSTWMEEHIRLPAGDAAVPGKIRMYGSSAALRTPSATR
jgi:hypothetical protein